jgi:glycine hydroxymethyltransferase
LKQQATGADLEVRRGAVRTWGNQPLVEAGLDVHTLMEREKERQVRGIQAVGKHLTNKYSEGHQVREKVRQVRAM